MSPFRLALCLAAAAVLLGGCASDLQLCVMDASTGQGISNASATIRKVTSFSYFAHDSQEYPAGRADGKGEIFVTGVKPKYEVYLRAPGYHGAVIGFAKRGWIGITSPYPPADPESMHLNHKLIKRTGIIEIPLEKGSNP